MCGYVELPSHLVLIYCELCQCSGQQVAGKRVVGCGKVLVARFSHELVAVNTVNQKCRVARSLVYGIRLMNQ